jgi:iron complex outermembrane receptor protein
LLFQASTIDINIDNSMKSLFLLNGALLALVGIPVGFLPAIADALTAETTPATGIRTPESTILRLKDREKPATTLKEWQAQLLVQTTPVQVTDIKIERTETGIDITLETADGKPLQVDANQFRTEGNILIADLPNAVLALPDRQPFQATNPTADITQVRVEQATVNSIRITIFGDNAPPKTEVTLKVGELSYSLNPKADEPDEEIVVTGEGQRGYRVPNATTGSRTDTPLRDLPFSVQVVPQELLQDRQVQSVNEALRTVAGVTPDNPSFSAFEGVTIRGFTGRNIIRNGLRDDTNINNRVAIPNIEQIEVLKGPTGALFSQGGPGGTVNIVTKKPLAISRYAVEGTIGNFDTYGGSLDFTGPLNDSKTLLYRLIAGASSTGTFIDFFDRRNYLIAPILTWQLSPSIKLTFEGEYSISEQPNARGLPARGTVLPNINGRLPRNRFIGEPEDELDKNDGQPTGFSWRD